MSASPRLLLSLAALLGSASIGAAVGHPYDAARVAQVRPESPPIPRSSIGSDARNTPAGGPAVADARLFAAAERGDVTTIKGLLAAGADANARNADGEAALHRAAFHGRGFAIDALIGGGAGVDARIVSSERHDDWTALMVAASECGTDVAQRLLKAGADVDARNHRGRTALLLAAWHGCIDVVHLLLAAGADRDAADAVGLTAARAATLAGDPGVLAAFRQRAGSKR